MVTYYPPSDESVDRFVREASERMAAARNDAGYLDPEVKWGLAAFIKLIGEIKARQLNEKTGSAFDSPEKRDYP